MTIVKLIPLWSQLATAGEILDWGMLCVKYDDWLYSYEKNSIEFRNVEDALAFRLRFGDIINSVDN